MKAGILLLVTSLVAVSQANYELSCAKSELSIRWPSYESNSEYYVCSHLFGRKMIVTCNPGEVFTFVLQSCTSPSRYIPPPALEVLPTASPLINKPNEDGYLIPIEIPNHPPLLTPPLVNTPVSQAQNKPPTIPVPSVIVADQTKPLQETKPMPIEESVVDVIEETAKPLAPLPPTPAPTPPVVEKETSKKPIMSGKKPAGKKPAGKKKKSSISGSTTSASAKKPAKKPNTVSGKKTPAKKAGKKSPKPDKKPKKSVRKPISKDKKSPKAQIVQNNN